MTEDNDQNNTVTGNKEDQIDQPQQSLQDDVDDLIEEMPKELPTSFISLKASQKFPRPSETDEDEQ